jgi:hypothetical protein
MARSKNIYLILDGDGYFLFIPFEDRLCGALNLLSNWYRVLFPREGGWVNRWGVQMTAHLPLVPKL